MDETVIYTKHFNTRLLKFDSKIQALISSKIEELENFIDISNKLSAQTTKGFTIRYFRVADKRVFYQEIPYKKVRLLDIFDRDEAYKDKSIRKLISLCI